jgi:hypothetical protein
MFVSTVTDQSRKFVFGCVETYRYGFNGQEKEKEITGSDTHTSAEFWMYDTRVGRRWQLDPKPLFSSSNYSTLLNSPISFFDLKGDTTIFYDINNGSFLGKIDDGSRLNHILINPDVYEEKMGGVAVENFQNDSKCADEMVADLISSAESLEITRNDGFDYIARESEQYLFIALTGGQGTLEWRVRFDNTAQITIGTWRSQSDNKKGDERHPEGTFELSNLMWRKDKPMWRDNVGFSIDIEKRQKIWDPVLKRDRTSMEIHPDGESNGKWEKNNGTEGCIGLQTNGSQLLEFYKAASSYFSNPNHKTMNLTVKHND